MKTETASRLRGRIESILDWAKVRGYRSGENPAAWRGHLDKILPSRTKVQKVRHHPALDFREISAFLQEVRSLRGLGAQALEFAILTAARSGEVRSAKWTDIDNASDTWIVPGDLMKGGKEHRIPLSSAAKALLSEIKKVPDCDLIFPNSQNGEMSDMTLTAVIRRLDKASLKAAGQGWRDRRSDNRVATVHGFRSTFRDWAGETTAHTREAIEHALSHQIKDKAEAAYARGTLFDKRRKLMEDWAKYCEVKTSVANVLSINREVVNA